MFKSRMLKLLTFSGQNGPVTLVAAMALGLAAPSLAEKARPFMGLAIFMFTLGAFLRVEPADARRLTSSIPMVILAWVWVIMGVPILTVILSGILVHDAELRTAIVIYALAPPAGSSTALAAMLGLDPPLALLLSMGATLMCPLYLPALTHLLLGADINVDPQAFALRLLMIVASAGVAATVVRRFANESVRANPFAMTGLAVAGLVVLALALTDGLQEVLIRQTARVLAYLLIALLINAVLQALGALVFAVTFRARALTIGLVSGNRNVALVWASSGASFLAHPQVELYFVVSTLAVFLMPLFVRSAFMLVPLTSGKDAALPRNGTKPDNAGACGAGLSVLTLGSQASGESCRQDKPV